MSYYFSLGFYLRGFHLGKREEVTDWKNGTSPSFPFSFSFSFAAGFLPPKSTPSGHLCAHPSPWHDPPSLLYLDILFWAVEEELKVFGDVNSSVNSSI
ncbi:hypothetical protein RchiOBHm_Chr4g0424481 [Rosa chinensis]|uniref:Uncharacterized protein n=1 Tax=Rosa chinensis TaxID=74649 RepID=A0A2P6QYV9_ROSCH|nr:hypothetical protein RchiOBHm_Chr4g0424481 [Rosa chinensis]